METLKKVFTRLGFLGGATAGIGLLAFAVGFLARRAQHDFAQLPFVFVDYWSYAETGLVSALTSLYLLLDHQFILVGIGVVSIGSILLLESPGFKNWITKAHWNFGAYLLLALMVALLLYQQFHIVGSLRNERILGRSDSQQEFPSTVPALGFFRWMIVDPLLPVEEEYVPPDNATIGWQSLADELEADLTTRPSYLQLRPRPTWVAPDLPGERKHSPILGARVEPKHLEERRAASLYGWVFCSFIFLLWATAMLEAWRRQVREALENPPEDDKKQNLRVRLREELWFAAENVLKPAVIALLLGCLVLLPECYGLLAMPRLSQEWIEIAPVVEAPGSTKPIPAVLSQEKGTDGGTTLSEDGRRETSSEEPLEALVNQNFSTGLFDGDEPQRLRRYIAETVSSWGFLEPGDRARAIPELIQAADQLIRTNDPENIQFLAKNRKLASLVAPDLLASGFARSIPSAGLSGYLLYYPRSDTDNFRLVQRDLYDDGRWQINSIKTSDTTEIRIGDVEATRKLVAILRNLPELNPSHRMERLGEVLSLGHSRSLEVFLMAVFEPRPDVSGGAVSMVGQLARALPDSPGGKYRKARAGQVLLSILEDPERRPDQRGAAATALYLFTSQEDPRVCAALLDILKAGGEKLGDQHWELRGAVGTALAKLKCQDSHPLLLQALESRALLQEQLPPKVLATVPSLLVQLGEKRESVAPLIKALRDAEADEELLATTLSALGRLGHLDPKEVVDALWDFLRPASPPAPELAAKEILRLTAIDALRQIGSRRALSILLELVDNRGELSSVRTRATAAISGLETPDAMPLLTALATDRNEHLEVRIQAILGLGEVGTLETSRVLEALYRQEIQQASVPSVGLCYAVVQALKTQARQGNSMVAPAAEDLEKDFVSKLTELRDQILIQARPGSRVALEGLRRSPADGGLIDQASPGMSLFEGRGMEERAVSSLRNGSLDDFLLVMAFGYFDPLLFRQEIERRFPSWDFESFRKETIARDYSAGSSWDDENQERQDLLALWVLNHRDELRFDPERGVYRLDSSL